MTSSETKQTGRCHTNPCAPLISVVTVVRNGELFLEETILSVIAQKNKNVEYIIIDGASTDATLSIIEKYKEHIDYWISEPDRGIYDAMNKGINASTGVCVGLLNCGDSYEQRTLKIVSEELMKITCRHFVIAGGISRIDPMNRITDVFIVGKKSLNNKLKYMPLNHPAMFVSRAVYKEIAMYNQELKISADYELVLKLLDRSVNILFIPMVLTRMRSGGISESPKSILIMLNEGFRIRRKYSGVLYCSFIVARELLSFMKFSLKSIKIPRIFQ
jgi:glycosyltransferase involved in cell wall biosynthesis